LSANSERLAQVKRVLKRQLFVAGLPVSMISQMGEVVGWPVSAAHRVSEPCAGCGRARAPLMEFAQDHIGRWFSTTLGPAS
jgi:hypothetical protein